MGFNSLGLDSLVTIASPLHVELGEVKFSLPENGARTFKCRLDPLVGVVEITILVGKGLVGRSGADSTTAIVELLLRLRAEMLKRLAIGVVQRYGVRILELSQLFDVELPRAGKT